jgi:hypothetical protein
MSAAALTAAEVQNILSKLGVPFVGTLGQVVDLADDSYEPVSRSWVLDTYLPWWDQFVFNSGLQNWQAFWNCRKFSRLNTVMAAVSFARAAAAGTGAVTPAIFSVYGIFPGVVGEHAVNLAIVENGGVLVYEPQLNAGNRPFVMQAADFANINKLLD